MKGHATTARAALALFVISMPLHATVTADAASPKPGSACKKAGTKVTNNGYAFTCLKSGKKLIWSKGIPIKKIAPMPTAKPTPSQSVQNNPTPSPSSSNNQVTWDWMDNQGKWVANGNPPACQFPIIPKGSLLDFSQPISLLQPGQVRGGSYKPHGGFRFSTYGTFIADIKIYVPFDGVVTVAAQYKTEGTFQFLVNIVSPCGFMARLGHLYIPSAQFTKILSNLPAPVEGDSRETFLNPPIPVKAGDLIASSVGMPPPASPDSMGSFMDFGLLDLRVPNPVVPADFTSNADPKYSRYSLCWYQGNYLSDSDKALVAKLPLSNGDSTSTYCK
ncbi:MAG: hypothetical protein Q8K86_07975 [Candidatus Nanopelagicaceae bacterium]|nr:hypothetical protein [Candidatus Nanopelagicaceae bacterium]